MCQLLGLSSSDQVRLTFSWETFVKLGSQQRGNPDGWGVAYFEGVDATLIREPTPAAESPLVQFLGSHAPRSNLIVSHVRRATGGDNKLVNTQPFLRNLGGHTHVFAHNGFVPNFELHNAPSWLMPLGDTDSEKVFCYLLSNLEPIWDGSGVPPVELRFEVVQRFARVIMEFGASNFLYSDGVNLFAHGHRHTIPGAAISSEPGLYVNTSNTKKGSDMTVPCEGLHAEGQCREHALVATLPLNNQKWVPLKPGEIACFESGQRIK